LARPNRLFQLIDDENWDGNNFTDWDGNSFPYMVENVIESTPYFAEGFHQAGQAVVARLREMEAWPDYEALPVVFLYRHAVELALKGIVWNGDEIAGRLGKPLSGSGGPQKGEHRLGPILKHVDHVQSVFVLHWLNEKITWDQTKDVINDLDAVDPGSFAFRYPMKRNGAPSQSAEFGFNVYEFATMLDPVLDGLRDWAYELEDHRSKSSS